jgi:hypothetical protein
VHRRLIFAMSLACALNAAAADDLRTLFHSADERVELDRLRRGDPPEVKAVRRGPPVVGGFVKRSDGRDTVWVDGRPVTGSEATRLADPAQVRESARNERHSIDIRTTR